MSKWLFAATLFLSVFSFSGYAAQKQSQQPLIKQTELVVNLSCKTNKATILYKEALSAFFSLVEPMPFHAKSSFEFNRLTKIKFYHLSQQDFIVLRSANYFQNKTIPKSSDEDHLMSHTG